MKIIPLYYQGHAGGGGNDDGLLRVSWLKVLIPSYPSWGICRRLEEDLLGTEGVAEGKPSVCQYFKLRR